MLFVILLGLFPLIFSEYSTTAFTHNSHQDNVCGQSQLSSLEGIISSPNYPSVYPNHTSCTWAIISPAKSKLTISVTDFDIEEDSNCNHPPCCLHTWLSLPKQAGGTGIQQYCGSNTLVAPVAVTQNVTFIKFHTSKVVKGGRGFQLRYTITGLCADGLVLCSSVDRRCFSDSLERCDGKFDCLFGEDEVGCEKGCPEDKIACISGEGCYSPLQRCDSIPNCLDGSDETNCPLCNTIINKFPCDNGRCISGELWCNGVDDCGDGSDEENCLKTLVITVAIMGSLLCGLLLIIAMGCVCRLYGICQANGENYRIHSARQEMLQPDERFFYREPPPAYTIIANDCQPLQRLSTSGRSTLLVAPDHCSRQHNRIRTSRRHLSGRRRSQRTLARISSPSDPEHTETVDFRPAPSSVANLPMECRLTVDPTENSANSILETAVEAQRESPNVTSECKSVSVSASAVDMVELHCEDGRASPLSTSTMSSLDSPSRESGTSSTSLLSYQSGTDDTELLIL